MPKIEVQENLFFEQLEKTYSSEELEAIFPVAKAELGEKANPAEVVAKGRLKIELNDTNRPDLWSTAGLARLLRVHGGGTNRAHHYQTAIPQHYEQGAAGKRCIKVDVKLQTIRPYIAAFIISGVTVTESLLNDIIQMQEKLCWNFGQKRKAIAMGVYRSDLIEWPINYSACDAQSTRFIPLGKTTEMSCTQILCEHEKGKDFGHIIADNPLVPILRDTNNNILSMPPVINSAHLGAVKVGDNAMLVELTGTNLESLLLATNICACNFIDFGFQIEAVQVDYPQKTAYGTSILFPQYFQKPTITTVEAVNKLLGSELSSAEILEALARMDSRVEMQDDGKIIVYPAPYRNDLLHEVDIIEDVMLGKAVDFFEPEIPHDFTVGRLCPVTLLSRRIKTLFVGFGYQEMVFNYLGSKKEYIDRMNIAGDTLVEIANPMSENYRFVRNSALPGLLLSEMSSANAVYPHRIFEIGKVAFLDENCNTGTRTIQSISFLTVAADANFNEAASQMASLLYYLDQVYSVRESHDPRFIVGRQAELLLDGTVIGVFGEVNPQVLQNWNIEVPAFGGEINIDALIEEK